jgi:hypothetical protein
MILTSLIGGGAKPYLEYGWVTAPSTASQSIASNTVTTLTIDTEVADSGNFGSIASNQITLAAGTYYYDAFVPVGAWSNDCIFSLYNTTTSAYISKIKALAIYGGAAYWNYYWNPPLNLKGQFTIATSSVFELRLAANGAIGVGVGSTAFTLSTAGADQRTTIKLWKLA